MMNGWEPLNLHPGMEQRAAAAAVALALPESQRRFLAGAAIAGGGCAAAAAAACGLTATRWAVSTPHIDKRRSNSTSAAGLLVFVNESWTRWRWRALIFCRTPGRIAVVMLDAATMLDHDGGGDTGEVIREAPEARTFCFF